MIGSSFLSIKELESCCKELTCRFCTTMYIVSMHLCHCCDFAIMIQWRSRGIDNLCSARRVVIKEDTTGEVIVETTDRISFHVKMINSEMSFPRLWP